MRKLFVAALFVVMTLSLSLIPAFAEAAVDAEERTVRLRPAEGRRERAVPGI